MACVAVFTLASCGEEDPITPIQKNASKITVEKHGGGGNTGGEEEEPIIIYGLTQTPTGSPIANAEVTLYDASTNQQVGEAYTNGNGNFEFSELEGAYYLVINASEYLPFQSTDLNFPESNGMIFILMQE